MDSNVIYLIPLAGLLALCFTYVRAQWVAQQEVGTERMARIAGYITDGAMAFLRAEYSKLAWFVVGVAVLLALTQGQGENSSPLIALSFAVGALCSGLAGFIGMKVATKANVRTTNAARTGLNTALNVAFRGGSVMGMGVVGLGVLGLSSLFLFYSNQGWDIMKVISVLTGFSFGASSIALFARVGGGIYTKAADVGADLVGKVEAGIPEDHPLNPATIADNVGDNVGDVAGMGADLFESYVGSMIGAMVLGALFMASFGESAHFGGLGAVLLPLFLAAIGIVASMVGTMFVSVEEGGDPKSGLTKGELGAAAIMLVGKYFLITNLLPESWEYAGRSYTAIGVFIASMLGLGCGIAIGFITEYYTGIFKKPVVEVSKQSVTGSATNIIAGIGVGMRSTMWPILFLAAAILGAYHFAGLYGIAIAAVGMLANTGIQLAVDAYGPIADNAGGIAEMSELPKEVRERTDSLDAVGNSTAAIGKGFAIGSAALTALALFAAYKESILARAKEAGLDMQVVIDVSDPNVMACLFVGAMLPFLFSAMAIDAVGRAAMAMIQEVRRQFANIPELKAALVKMNENDGKPVEKWSKADQKVYEAADGKAEYAKCVDISTTAAIREMIMPGMLAVLTPVVVAFGFKYATGDAATAAQALGGLLAGVTVSGVLLALFQANAGGAWDNAKKMFEVGDGVEVDGEFHKKGSDAHKAGVVGDTVGDPLKDTSGPSLNILLKLMSVIALVIAPLLVEDASGKSSDDGKNGKANVEQKGGKEAKGSKAVNEDNNDTTPKPKDKDGNGTKKKGESSSLLRSTYVDVG
ncbi:MAG: sodium-translocating pyrophosphatase [Verrucomicrobiota bacterium]|nr:sodium-translocating pyrophosphatase [Verrucomicrobiota bacterium]